ncbi:MAG: hypothetical protein GXO79_12960 [Chlorobi bacterium]|nr:hypothetical protein [Chlorobiota bacterium]
MKYLKKISLIILIIGIFFPHLSFTQIKINDKNLVNSITIKYADSVVETATLKVNPSIKLNNDVEYYWYSSNKIHKNYGGFSGQLLDGEENIWCLIKIIK